MIPMAPRSHDPSGGGVPRSPRSVHRPTAAKRGYGRAWRKASRAFLRINRRCVRCRRQATEVDHVTPHGGDARLFWASANWQPMCKSCHSKKTRAESPAALS